MSAFEELLEQTYAKLGESKKPEWLYKKGVSKDDDKPKQKDEWEDQYNILLNLITIETKTKRNATAVNVLQKCLMDLENSEK